MHETTGIGRSHPNTNVASQNDPTATSRRLWVTIKELEPWLVAPALAELKRLLFKRGVDVDLARVQLDLELSGIGATAAQLVNLADELNIALAVTEQ